MKMTSWAFCLVLLFTLPAYARSVTVTFVHDGDTIFAGGKKVRLIGVNAPEAGWPEKGKEPECFGKEAHLFLKGLLLNKKVRLKSEGAEFDKYGRRLAYVYLGDVLVNEELVRKGFAYTYTYFKFSKKERWKELQKEAKASGLGIWGACDVRCRGHACKIGFP